MFAEKKLREDGFEFMGFSLGVPIFRKQIKRRAKWAAIVNEVPIRISYDQALGKKPIVVEEANIIENDH